MKLSSNCLRKDDFPHPQSPSIDIVREDDVNLSIMNSARTFTYGGNPLKKMIINNAQKLS